MGDLKTSVDSALHNVKEFIRGVNELENTLQDNPGSYFNILLENSRLFLTAFNSDRECLINEGISLHTGVGSPIREVIKELLHYLEPNENWENCNLVNLESCWWADSGGVFEATMDNPLDISDINFAREILLKFLKVKIEVIIDTSDFILDGISEIESETECGVGVKLGKNNVAFEDADNCIYNLPVGGGFNPFLASEVYEIQRELRGTQKEDKVFPSKPPTWGALDWNFRECSEKTIDSFLDKYRTYHRAYIKALEELDLKEILSPLEEVQEVQEVKPCIIKENAISILETIKKLEIGRISYSLLDKLHSKIFGNFPPLLLLFGAKALMELSKKKFTRLEYLTDCMIFALVVEEGKTVSRKIGEFLEELDFSKVI